MLHNIQNIERLMPKGDSGRVVIEVDPTLKRRLYSALAIESATMKDWFVDAAEQYVSEQEKKNLREAAAKYGGSKKP